MDNPVQPDVGRGRLLRGGSRRSGMQQISGAAERITRGRGAWRPWLRDLALETASKGGAMALSFPNKSRAFDATRRAVRFWGHDSAMSLTIKV